jgi:photosystem II stability/assembly factor-like uncharacterized protein
MSWVVGAKQVHQVLLTHGNMKDTIARALSKLIIGIVMIAFACDAFQEDEIPANKKISFSQTHFYLLPETSTVIDIQSVLSTFTKGLLNISKMPAKGVISEFDPLVLIYRPNSNFIDGTDQFEISITENGKTIATQQILISVVQYKASIPCGIFALQDNRALVSNQNIVIEFRENDQTCGFKSEDIETTIYASPKYGQAKLVGDAIVYTPGSEINIIDTIVYKISVRNPNPDTPARSSMGLIKVTGLSCLQDLPKAVVLDMTDEVNDETTVGACGAGVLIYQFSEQLQACRENKSLSVTPISQTALSGNICYQSDGRFVFIPNHESIPQNEVAEFEICRGDHCQVIEIYVQQTEIDWAMVSAVTAGGLWEEHARTIFFLDETTGFVGGESLWKTSNGGDTWRRVHMWPTAGDLVNDIYFLDKNNGFAAYGKVNANVGTPFQGGLLKTVDGGEHWSVLETPNELILSVWFISQDVGFFGASRDPVTTNSGLLYRTTDGGAHWTLSSTTTFFVRDIQFMNDNVGFAQAGRTVLRTDNSGESWIAVPVSSISTDPNEGIAGMANNGSEIFFELGNAMWASSDGKDFLLKRGDEYGRYYGAISFSPSGQLGIAVGSAGGWDWPQADAVISTDKGETWWKSNMDYSLFKELFLVDVSIPTDNVAFAISEDGHLVRCDR